LSGGGENRFPPPRAVGRKSDEIRTERPAMTAAERMRRDGWAIDRSGDWVKRVAGLQCVIEDKTKWTAVYLGRGEWRGPLGGAERLR
jgi:hypothetical protein